MKKLSIIFFGNEKLFTGPGEVEPIVLPNLIRNGHEIKALILHKKPDLHKSKSSSKIEEVAQKNQVKIIYINSDSDLYKCVEKNKADIGIVVAFGKIIPQSVLDYFSCGVINIHPSLLPKYRGPSPIEQTILDGQEKTGVSIIKLTKEMDSGPIYQQAEIELVGKETKNELAQKLLKLGSNLVEKTLVSITAGNVKSTSQDGTNTSFTHFIKKSDGQIRPGCSYNELDKHIRAMFGWPGSFIVWNNLTIFILSINPSEEKPKKDLIWQSNKKLYFSCSDKPAQIIELKIAGKSNISAIDFINAYKPPKF